MIEFEEGSVCYANGTYWSASSNEGLLVNLFAKHLPFDGLFYDDFQLSEPREGWYIPKSELDTEEKYKQAVEVFGLFGYFRSGQYARRYDDFMHVDVEVALACSDSLLMGVGADSRKLITRCTFDQLMAIGELKRKMLDKVEADLITESNTPEIPDSSKRNKSKQAYKILNDLGIEYDQVKQQWYKKKYL